MLVGLDSEMNVTLINRKTEKASGFKMEEAIGNPVHSALEDFARVMKNLKNAIKERQTYSVPDFLLEKNGEKRFYNLILFPLIANGVEGAVVRIEDVTDTRRIDEQLRQAQKMETVGNLAGGLAHDFNNVLSGIVGTVSLIKHLMYKDNILNEKFTNYIDIIERSGKRAAEMVQQLLTLSRRYEVAMRPLDLNLSLRNVMQICHNTFDKSVEVIAEFAPGKAIINGDPSQVEQVILNLCINAAHAMTIMRSPGDKQGGNLSVSIRHIKADVYFCSVHPEAKPGSYWMVGHSDNGVGMDEDTLRSIFDPFFTTKERDQGTGLGLAMVYSIIHHHHGFIDVYSEKGVGSTFNVYFPEMTGEGELEHPGFEPVVEKGEGTILVIDDEAIVRLMAESILKECGYDVISADNGREGVEIFRNRSDSIDAVLLDMAMPGMSGREVFIELQKIVPSVKVLLASGFRQDYRVDEVMKLGIAGFIQKPYSLGDLSKKIKGITSA
jgi:PAS domain S-box-containing protein